MMNVRNLVGSTGVTQTKLSPLGIIEIEGERFDAVVRNSPTILQGEEVVVTDVFCFFLIVRVRKTKSNN